MKRIQYLFWDWNGTLLDDVALCFQTINAMLQKRSLRPFETLDEYRRTFRFPVEEYYKLAGFDFEKESFTVLAHEYMALYQPASLACEMHGRAAAVLKRLWEEKILQVVLSASERGNLMSQVGRYNIARYFQDFLGIEDVFARGKVGLGLRWMEEHDIDPETALLIGDTVHDYEVARAMGCRALLYSGGHQDRKRLEMCGCPVVERTEDILDSIL